MAARDKTKDSVSLLPCFYFVEVSSRCFSRAAAELLHMHEMQLWATRTVQTCAHFRTSARLRGRRLVDP